MKYLLRGYRARLAYGAAVVALVAALGYAMRAAPARLPPIYAAAVLAACGGAAASAVVFVAQMAFFNRVSDPKIGGPPARCRPAAPPSRTPPPRVPAPCARPRVPARVAPPRAPASGRSTVEEAPPFTARHVHDDAQHARQPRRPVAGHRCSESALAPPCLRAAPHPPSRAIGRRCLRPRLAAAFQRPFSSSPQPEPTPAEDPPFRPAGTLVLATKGAVEKLPGQPNGFHAVASCSVLLGLAWLHLMQGRARALAARPKADWLATEEDAEGSGTRRRR